MTKKSGVGENIINLPKGGGALKGIDGQVHVNQQKGVLDFTIPLTVPPSRNDFTPVLSLLYSSANGNGLFGLGWSLNIPYITRKLSMGVPLYQDLSSQPTCRDKFVYSEEDLVLIEEDFSIPGNIKQYYQLKVEGKYIKIERNISDNKDYWIVYSPDGLKYYYGAYNDDQAFEENVACIANTNNPKQIFKWMLAKTEDVFGNVIYYEYFNTTTQCQHNQLYLSKISYANYLDNNENKFLYSINFDYGRPEDSRPDPFSSYKSGFEIRTTKRCKQIIIKCHEKPTEELIKSYDFHYLETSTFNNLSLIKSIEVTGHKGDEKEKLPPIEFDYTPLDFSSRKFETVNFQNNTVPGISLANPNLVLADIFGNGLPCLLHTQRQHYQYWVNDGSGFQAPRVMPYSPPEIISDSGVTFADIQGKGRADLLISQGQNTGFYSLHFDGTWKNWHSYSSAPSFNIEDPNVRLFDVTGNGLIDVCLSRPEAFLFFLNQGKAGWSLPLVVSKLSDLALFPAVNFGDYGNRVRLADMSGDGMQDILLIHQHQIDYWPNLGFGRFGKRVSMSILPILPAEFDPQRVFLADIDGDGCNDLIYLDKDAILIWSNRQGNAFSHCQTIQGMPPIFQNTLQIADLKGHGMPGMLWSNDYSTTMDNRYKFFDFTNGEKPYLLKSINNNLGAIIKISYQPSTHFYLKDKQAGFEWKSNLPFPVYCVSQVETFDYFSKTKLVQDYHYHHGYWDGVNKEFCGFGRVDQRDTQQLKHYNAPCTDNQVPFFGTSEEFFSPPIETRSWFHLGAVINSENNPKELNYNDEYWSEDPYPEAFIPSQKESTLMKLLPIEQTQALRALRGMLLRTEVYSSSEMRPYTVSDNVYNIFQIPRNGINGEKIFEPQVYYQRRAQWDSGMEPLIHFKINDNYDEYGQAQKEINIAVPRERCTNYYNATSSVNHPYWITKTESQYAISNQRYIINCLANVKTFEVVNQSEEVLLNELPMLKLINLIKSGNTDIKLIDEIRYYYDGDAFIGLPMGEIGKFGILVRSQKLVLTDDIIRAAYQDERNYNFSEAGYNIATQTLSGTKHYFTTIVSKKYDFHDLPRAYYGLLLIQKDGLNHETRFEYDRYAFKQNRIILPCGLVTSMEYDYLTGMPSLVTDCNDNLTYYQFTPLSLVKSIIQTGKSSMNEGDTIDYPGTIYQYHWNEFYNHKKPVYVHTLRRTKHYYDYSSAERAQFSTNLSHELTTFPERFIQQREYSDGFGRMLQTRSQSELATIVSGRQEYDNKGRIIKKFEPYIGTGWEYQENNYDSAYITMQYDLLGRLKLTKNFDGSIQKIIYGSIKDPYSYPPQIAPTPWEYFVYDANDNTNETHQSLTSDYYNRHYSTPTGIKLDAFNQVVETIAYTKKQISNGWQQHILCTKNTYDSRGNLIEVKDAMERLAFKYIYDLANQRIYVENIDAGIKRMLFNAVGALIEQCDSKGALLHNTYDALNRLTESEARDKASAPITLRIKNIYGTDKTHNLCGKLYKVYDEAGMVTYSGYDFKGNLLDKERQVLNTSHVDWSTVTDTATVLDSNIYHSQYCYDALNRLREIISPSFLGRTQKVQIQYNQTGLLKIVSLDNNFFVKNIIYNSKGQREQMELGNGLITAYEYDPKTFRLIRTNTGNILDMSYQYDLVGNIRQIKESAITKNFDYDPQYQVISASGREHIIDSVDKILSPWLSNTRSGSVEVYDEHYEYDDVGNLKQLKHNSPSNDFIRNYLLLINNSNKLKKLDIETSGRENTIDYQYDLSGNISQEATRKFQWNYHDQMIEARDSTGSNIAYLYDHLGKRVKKIITHTDGKQESIVYIDSLYEHSQLTQPNQITQESHTLHIMDEQKRIAEIRFADLPQTPEIRYHFSDQVESSLIVTDENGSEIHREEYTPYGETTYGGAIDKRYRFNGKERDTITELYYYGARYYAPWLGRWMSADPAGPVDLLNLFSFNKLNPLRFSDPTGCSTEEKGNKKYYKIQEEGKPYLYKFVRGGNDQEIIILNNRAATMQTILELKNPDIAHPLISAGIKKLQTDFLKYGSNFPNFYYEEFGKFLINQSILLNRGDIGKAMSEVKETVNSADGWQYGIKWKYGSSLYHLYENIVSSQAQYDKLVHFSASAYWQYKSKGTLSWIMQHGKEGSDYVKKIFLPSEVGYDDADMLANEKGQKFAESLPGGGSYIQDITNGTARYFQGLTNAIEHEIKRKFHTLRQPIHNNSCITNNSATLFPAIHSVKNNVPLKQHNSNQFFKPATVVQSGLKMAMRTLKK